MGKHTFTHAEEAALVALARGEVVPAYGRAAIPYLQQRGFIGRDGALTDKGRPEAERISRTLAGLGVVIRKPAPQERDPWR